VCNRGGIFIVKRKDGLKVEIYEEGKAPKHEHWGFWLQSAVTNRESKYTMEDGYPKLDSFPINSGIVIGFRSDLDEKGSIHGRMRLAPFFVVDGISFD